MVPPSVSFMVRVVVSGISYDRISRALNGEPGALLAFGPSFRPPPGSRHMHPERTHTPTSRQTGQACSVFGYSSGLSLYRGAMGAGAQDAWAVASVPAISGNEAVDSNGRVVGLLRAGETTDRAA